MTIEHGFRVSVRSLLALALCAGLAVTSGAGVLAAQEIKPQARVLAEDRGIRCVMLDYAVSRGTDDSALRLF